MATRILTLAHQPGRYNPRVVDHQAIVRPKQFGQISNVFVFQRFTITLRAFSPISTSNVRMISALPPKIAITTAGVGMTGVKPAKTMKVATASSKAAPTANGPDRPAVRPSSKRRPQHVVIARGPQPNPLN